MTLNQLAFNVLKIANNFQGDSDDVKLSLRQIKFWISQYRASGMKLYTDFGKNIAPQFFQDLGVVPLENVDKSDSNCPEVPWGCSIKKVEIPRLIDLPNYRNVWIGLIDKQTPFVIDEPNTHFFNSRTRFGNVFTRVYQIGDVFYIVTKDDHDFLEYINIRGIFENPEEVYTYAQEGCAPVCFNPNNEEYPMPAGMYEFVLRSILNNELRIGMSTIDDIVNNNQVDLDAARAEQQDRVR